MNRVHGTSPETIASPQSRIITQSLLFGLVTGLVDALLIQMDVGGRHVFYLTPWLWFWVPLIWISFCLAVGFVCLIPPLRRLALSALLAAGPGVLLISRGGPALKHGANISTAAAIGACLIVLAFLLIAGLRLPWPRALVLRSPAIVLILCGTIVLAVGAGMSRRSGVSTAVPVRVGESQRPNVVLIFLDTMRYDDARRMSNLVRFGASAITFENAWAPAPWTIPSHFSVLTGADPSSIDFVERFRRFPDNGVTLAQQLAERGYTTRAVFANPLLNPRTGFNRGFEWFEYSQSFDGCRSGLAALLHSAEFHGYIARTGICGWMSASEVVQDAIAAVDSAKRPYFLAVNFIDPHAPYFIEPQCRDSEPGRYTRSDWALFGRISNSGGRGVLPAPVSARVHSQYQAAVRCMDRSLGQLIDYLDHQPDRRRTIVAIVGDHGEEFGEHGFVGHGNTLFSQALHVPLMVRVPGAPPRRVEDPVNISYLHDTLLESAGVSGRNRRTLFSGSSDPVWASVFPDLSVWSIVDRTYHVVRFADGQEEVFDTAADPSEQRPLAVNDTHVQALTSALDTRQHIRGKSDSRFRGLGYIQ